MCWSVKPSYPDELRLLVEASLQGAFRSHVGTYPALVCEAMRYSLLSDGKRFRPVLVLLAAELVGLKKEKALPTACAVEYIHTYSLIHDDLPAIDNDDMRRGRPSCHVKFGEDIAILGGDGLFAEAFRLISTEQSPERPDLVVAVLREIAGASGVEGMVGGQVVDVLSAKKEVDAETLDFIHRRKTGRLITAAVKSGAILGDASHDVLQALEGYGDRLGLAFQITDDILDLTGDEAVIGKPVGSDAQQAKATFPGVYGLEEARRMARRAADEAKAALASLGGKSGRLAEMADFVCERRR